MSCNCSRTTTILTDLNADGAVTIPVTTTSAGINGINTTTGVAVIDWISYTNTAAAVAESWTLTCADAIGTAIYTISQQVLAGEIGSIFVQFTGGLPVFVIDATTGRSTGAPSHNGTVALTGANTGNGFLQIGLHWEPRALRGG